MVDGTENDIKPNGNYSSDNNLLIDCKNVDVFTEISRHYIMLV